MPKDTFFNLPEEKKNRIIDSAIDEFGILSFHKARVTVIAKDAGIATGSFYQYFEDKKDLYRYIMELIITKKLEYINHDMMTNREKYGFFQLLHGLYLSGLRFAKENPKLLAVGNKLLANKELQDEIWGENIDKSREFFRKLLQLGMDRGELDHGLDIEVASHLLTGLNQSLVDIIYKNGKINIDDFSNEMEIIDKMLYIIENGIKRKG